MRERGITMVALVITIIVLIIIAGVSITIFAGNDGVVNKASIEKNNFDSSIVKNNVKLAVLKAVENGVITEQNLINALNNKIGQNQYTLTKNNETNNWIITVGNLKFSVTNQGVVNEVNDTMGE